MKLSPGIKAEGRTEAGGPGGCRRLSGTPSHSHKVRNGDKRQSQYDEQNSVGNKIGEDHQGDAARQRYDRLLPFAVDEEGKPD